MRKPFAEERGAFILGLAGITIHRTSTSSPDQEILLEAYDLGAFFREQGLASDSEITGIETLERKRVWKVEDSVAGTFLYWRHGDTFNHKEFC